MSKKRGGKRGRFRERGEEEERQKKSEGVRGREMAESKRRKKNSSHYNHE